jgi:hypothetical protein
MKSVILSVVLTLIASYGFMSVAASMMLSAKQVEVVYTSIQAGR